MVKIKSINKMTDTPHYLNHRKRLRERFLKAGSEGMHNYELLELLLRFLFLEEMLNRLLKN